MAAGGELYDYGIYIKILKTSEAVLLHRVGHWAARSSERSLISVLRAMVYIYIYTGVGEAPDTCAVSSAASLNGLVGFVHFLSSGFGAALVWLS